MHEGNEKGETQLHAGDHAHLGYGLTAKRLTNPAIEIEELPFIDFCVLSHYHDRVTYLSHGETYNFEVPAERLQAA